MDNVLDKLKYKGVYEAVNKPFQSPYYFQEAIQKFSKAILCVFDLSELIKLMLTAVTETFEVNKASILLKDKQSLEYRVKTFRGFKKDIANKIKLKGEKGIADWLHREGRILRKEDLSTEEASSEHFSIIKELITIIKKNKNS